MRVILDSRALVVRQVLLLGHTLFYLNNATAERVSSVDWVLGDLFHEQIRVLAFQQSAKEVGAALSDSPN